MRARSMFLFSLIAAGIVAIGPSLGYAASVTWTGTQGDLEASATFDVVGDDLVVTLSNISASDVLVPADILTAVFFDLVSSPTLTPISVIPALGSTVLFGGTDGNGEVGGEWALADGLSGSPGDATIGLSSVGLGLFGPPDLFPGDNLEGPSSPNGLQYGLTSAGDDSGTGNTPVTGSNALVQSAVVLTVDGVGAGFDPSSEVSNVWFQYGTDLAEPSFPGVPEPTTLSLLALAGAGALWSRRRAK